MEIYCAFLHTRSPMLCPTSRQFTFTDNVAMLQNRKPSNRQKSSQNSIISWPSTSQQTVRNICDSWNESNSERMRSWKGWKDAQRLITDGVVIYAKNASYIEGVWEVRNWALVVVHCKLQIGYWTLGMKLDKGHFKRRFVGDDGLQKQWKSRKSMKINADR